MTDANRAFLLGYYFNNFPVSVTFRQSGLLPIPAISTVRAIIAEKEILSFGHNNLCELFLRVMRHKREWPTQFFAIYVDFPFTNLNAFAAQHDYGALSKIDLFHKRCLTI